MIDEFWIGNFIYWTILQLMTTLYRSLSHIDQCSQPRCLVAASKGSRPCRLVTISRQPHTLTAVSMLYISSVASFRDGLNWLPILNLQRQLSILDWSVGRLNAAGLRQHIHSWLHSLRDPRPRFLFSPRHVHVSELGLLLDEAGVRLAI
jgi:hypothetical protein